MIQSGSSSSSSSVVLLKMNQTSTTTAVNGHIASSGRKRSNNSSSNSSSNSNSSNGSKQQRLQSYQRAIFAALFVGYACYTYNRKSVSYATPTLLATGLITTNTMGIISSCQSMAYAVSKFLGGVLSDKMSARILFSVGLFVSGGSTLLFSRTEDPAVWAVLWFLNGFAQGCGWPSCAKLLKKWFSPASFGTWWSILTASSNLSGTLSPLLAAYVIINHGWGPSLIIAGLVSLVMAGVTLVTLVDDPVHVHLPEVSPAAHAPAHKSGGGSGGGGSGGSGEGGVVQLLRSPFLWVVGVCYLAVFLAKTALAEWGQLFLINELGRSQLQASSFTSAVETGGFFGGIMAGVVTDRIASKAYVRGNGRLMVAAVFMAACCAGLHVMGSVLSSSSSQMVVSGVGMVLGASMFGPISIYGIVASESFPAHLSGTAHALVALAANVGAVLAGWPLSWLARVTSWTSVIIMLKIIAAASSLLILTTTRYHITHKAKTS